MKSIQKRIGHPKGCYPEYFSINIQRVFGGTHTSFHNYISKNEFCRLDLMIFIKLPVIGICRQMGYNAFNPIAWVGCYKYNTQRNS